MEAGGCAAADGVAGVPRRALRLPADCTSAARRVALPAPLPFAYASPPGPDLRNMLALLLLLLLGDPGTMALRAAASLSSSSS